MLSRDKRLRRERDITRVYSKGRYGGGTNLQVKTLVTGLSSSRAAIVVSKKVSKKAVVRNRIKRRIAALMAQDWQTVRPGCDIVVSVKVDAGNLTPTDLASELTAALRKSGALIETKGHNV